MTADLFADHTPPPGEVAMLGPSARVLRGFALPRMDALWAALQDVTLQAPFRHMVTPGGQRMSVALTNCGALGWVSDRRGYRYAPGTRLSLHQDRDERDFSQPIVSVSLGVPAVFLWGGLQRSERAARVPLWHGDVVVWGGADRLRFHGVTPVPDGLHPLTGAERINFTFRRAG